MITIDVIEGVLKEEQKLEMIRRVSEVVAEIEGRPEPKENVLPFVYCIVRENKWGNFASNGEPITPELMDVVRKGIVHLTMESD